MQHIITMAATQAERVNSGISVEGRTAASSKLGLSSLVGPSVPSSSGAAYIIITVSLHDAVCMHDAIYLNTTMHLPFCI